MVARREYPSREFFETFFVYEPEAGKLFNRMTRGTRAKAGCETGFSKMDKRGLTHRQTVVDGEAYYVHVIIWIMNIGQIPAGKEIDHEDGDGLNNRLGNLRVVSRFGNMRNMALPKNNKSGQMGVFRSGFTWIARIRHNGKNVTVGSYRSKAKAVAARKEAEKRFGYHANHGKIRPGFEPDNSSSWRDLLWA